MSFISQSVTDGVTVVAIDRPPANAMNVELLDELVARLEELAADSPSALVVAGREGFFSAGADLKAVPRYDAGDQRKMVSGINRMAILTYGLPCPVIGAITGHAIAGGLVFALCADYRIASDAGRYGLTEIKVGRGPVPAGCDRGGPGRAEPGRGAHARARQRADRRRHLPSPRRVRRGAPG